jgi:hypothetical protein
MRSRPTTNISLPLYVSTGLAYTGGVVNEASLLKTNIKLPVLYFAYSVQKCCGSFRGIFQEAVPKAAVHVKAEQIGELLVLQFSVYRSLSARGTKRASNTFFVSSFLFAIASFRMASSPNPPALLRYFTSMRRKMRSPFLAVM